MATLSVPPSEHEQTPRAMHLGGVFFWGAVLLLIVGIVAYLVIGFGLDHFTDADAARVLERQKILSDRVTEDNKYLQDKPSWFKKDAGLVRVPIDEAMAMTLPVLQANKPHPAYPISQSPPQNAGAPTSPDKGAAPGAAAGPGKTNDINPSASNPTVGQSSPAPAAPSTTPAPATAASNAPAAPSPSPTVAPAATNNANNPGKPPIPGTQAQPSAPPVETNTSGAVPSAAPGAQAAPLTHPPGQPTPTGTASPASGSTPTPNPQEPGASPAGTP